MSITHSTAFVASKYPSRTDLLVFGAQKAADFGFTSIKLYLNPNYNGSFQLPGDYPNQVWSGTYTNLVSLAQDPAFASVFSNTKLTTFFFNTWTFTNPNNYGIAQATPAQLAGEYTEIYNLASHFLQTYPGKTFIIQNWEGDWMLLNSFDVNAPIANFRTDRFAALLRERQKAVEKARRDYPSTATVKNIVEVNRCLDRYSARVHREVAKFVKPDMLTFSAYECINTLYTNNQAASEAEIDRRLRLATNIVRHYMPGIPVAVTEYGWPEDMGYFQAYNLNVGSLIQQVVNTSNSLGMPYLAFWELFDNEEQSPGVPRGFYIFNTSMSLGQQGTKYQTLL